MQWLIIGLASFALASGLTALVVRYAPRLGFVDTPVARSAHAQPKPLGGGVALVVPYFLAVIYLSTSGAADLIPAALACLLVAAIGLADDFTPMSLRYRFPIQVMAAFFVVWHVDLLPVDFLLYSLDSPWLLSGLAFLSLVWLCNLYNFMDGIDGIAASQLLFVSLACALFIVISAQGEASTEGLGSLQGGFESLPSLLLCAVLAGSAAGFLLWNWSPAQLFMGDCGSAFAGFVLGLLALDTLSSGVMTVWSWLLLLGVFVVDTGVTLVRRVYAGQRWHEGHSQHAYQHLARKFKSHSAVVLALLLMNGVWLLPLALLAGNFPQFGILFATVGLAPLIVIAVVVGAGKELSIH